MMVRASARKNLPHLRRETRSRRSIDQPVNGGNASNKSIAEGSVPTSAARQIVKREQLNGACGLMTVL
jgi:hypothetical protein